MKVFNKVYSKKKLRSVYMIYLTRFSISNQLLMFGSFFKLNFSRAVCCKRDRLSAFSKISFISFQNFSTSLWTLFNWFCRSMLRSFIIDLFKEDYLLNQGIKGKFTVHINWFFSVSISLEILKYIINHISTFAIRNLNK